MEEIGKALKTIFDKLSDFFDIFDLSFFVSGFFTTGIIGFWCTYRGLDIPAFNSTGSSLVAIILVCYINGLLSFALGRWVRMGIFGYPYNLWRKYYKGKGKPFDEQFENIIKAHGLDTKPVVTEYLQRVDQRGIWRLYVRFWADLRNDEKYAKSLSFLKRYWVMSATYDGLSISVFSGLLLLIEARVGLVNDPVVMSDGLFFSAVAILIILLIACLREADRFVKYQIEEVIATIASKG